MWTLTSLLEGLDFADDVALVSFYEKPITAETSCRPLTSSQTTGLQHQQEENQATAAYGYTITSGIGEGRFRRSREIYLLGKYYVQKQRHN